MLLVALFLYFSVSIATPPDLPPYNQFIINGKIDRINKPKENFIVTLVGKFNQRNGKGTILDLTGDYYSGISKWKAVTDSTGNFAFDLKWQNKADSLGIKISSPDRSPYISPFFYTGTPTKTLTEQYQDAQGSGCRSSNMSTDPQVSIKIVGYQYYFSQKNIYLPY